MSIRARMPESKGALRLYLQVGREHGSPVRGIACVAGFLSFLISFL